MGSGAAFPWKRSSKAGAQTVCILLVVLRHKIDMYGTLYHFIMVKFFPYLHQLIEIIKVLLFINGNFLLLHNNLLVHQTIFQLWNQVEPKQTLFYQTWRMIL